MNRLACEITALTFCCGVGEIGAFDDFWNPDRQKHDFVSGTGLAISTITNTENQRKAYEFIRKNFKILYQSPVLPNKIHNDETEIFLIIYKVKRGS